MIDILFRGSDSIYKNKFIDIEMGKEYRIRILTNPYQIFYHIIDGSRLTIMCPRNSCKMCKSFSPTYPLWILGLIDRADGLFKMMILPQSLFRDMQRFVKDEDWGDPINYDIGLSYDKTSIIQWSVGPKTYRPLSESDLEIKNSIIQEEIDKLLIPMSEDKINLLLTFS